MSVFALPASAVFGVLLSMPPGALSEPTVLLLGIPDTASALPQGVEAVSVFVDVQPSGTGDLDVQRLWHL